MWETGRVLLEEEGTSLAEKICFELVGRMEEKRRNWATVELYKEVMGKGKDLTKMEQNLEKLLEAEPSYL